MLSPLPRRSGWACCFAHSPQPYQPSPITLSGRPAHCPFRGLLGVHSRYGLHTRAVTVYRDTLIEGFSHFVTSMTAPIASGWSGCRVGLAPTGKRRLFTAHGRNGHCADIANRSLLRAPSVVTKRERWCICAAANVPTAPWMPSARPQPALRASPTAPKGGSARCCSSGRSRSRSPR